MIENVAADEGSTVHPTFQRREASKSSKVRVEGELQGFEEKGKATTGLERPNTQLGGCVQGMESHETLFVVKNGEK